MNPLDLFLARVEDARVTAAVEVATYPRLSKIEAYGVFCARLADAERLAVCASLAAADSAYAEAVRFAKGEGIL